MMIRTTVTSLLVLATAFAQPPGRGPGGPGGPGARFIGAQPGMPGRVVKNAPYSAEMVTETTQALADGNRIKQTTTSRYFRDSDGRTRREQSLDALNNLAPNSNLPNAIFINDPVAGVNLAMNPSDHTATRSRAPRAIGESSSASPRSLEGRPEGRPGPAPRVGEMNGRRGPQGSPRDVAGPAVRRRSNESVKSEDLGTQVIEGVAAQGTRTTMTIAAGQIGNEQPMQVVTETWYSPDLQTVVRSHRSDPRSGEVTFRLTNISRAEPSRTMFETPVDYKVSEMSRPGRGPMRN